MDAAGDHITSLYGMCMHCCMCIAEHTHNTCNTAVVRQVSRQLPAAFKLTVRLCNCHLLLLLNLCALFVPAIHPIHPCRSLMPPSCLRSASASRRSPWTSWCSRQPLTQQQSGAASTSWGGEGSSWHSVIGLDITRNMLAFSASWSSHAEHNVHRC